MNDTWHTCGDQVAGVSQYNPEDPGQKSGSASLQDLNSIWHWNSSVPQPVNLLFHDVFADIVEAYPTATAVDAWDGAMSYAELDSRSSALASYLESTQNLKHGHITFILSEKSLWTSVAVLAVSKAGSAFVLLDANQSIGHLKRLTARVNAEMVITSPSMELQARHICSKAVIIEKSATFFHDEEFTGRDYSASAETKPSSLLYALFTSGSTGQPKMVTVSHNNIMSALIHQSPLIKMDRNTRYLDFAAYSFDVSVHHMLATFTSGSCLCVPSEDIRLNHLGAFVNRMGVNFAHLTPSSTRLIDPEGVPGLKTLLLSGEPVNHHLVKRWAPYLTLINAYGPAECSILSTAHECSLQDSPDVPIGVGYGCVTWIVSPHNVEILLPIGQVGELLLEGPIVGCGYYDDPKTTSKAFIKEPEWLRKGYQCFPGRKATLYKTGDLVRYDADGKRVFVGRKDLQVKIRGQRVELGEIEHHILTAAPSLTAVFAELIESPDGGGSQLVAFLRWKESDLPTEEQSIDEMLLPRRELFASFEKDLRIRLADTVAPYMIPSIVVFLRYLPLTPSGKVDRQLLNRAGRTMLAQAREESSGEGLSGQETALRDLWLLNLGKRLNIGPLDHYFILGGDSISAIQLAGLALKQNKLLSTADISKFPILRDMAAKMIAIIDNSARPQRVDDFSLIDSSRRHQIIQEAASKLDLDEGDIEDIYPCTPMQAGLHSLGAKRSGAYIVRKQFRLRPETSISRLRAAWNSVVEANRILRTRIIHIASSGPMQVVLRGSRGAKTSLNEDSNDSSRMFKSFLDQRGPLICLEVVPSEAVGQSTAVMTAHHAVCDGWQNRLVLDELEEAYKGAVLKTKPEFNTFVSYLSQQYKPTQLDYWNQQFSGEDMPAIFPSSPQKTLSGQWASSVASHRILAIPESKPSEFTLSMKLRLALAILIGSYTNSADVVFGLTLNGRNAPVEGIERLVGPTLTTVPLRVKLQRSSTIQQLLKSLNQQSLDMIPFEHVGLEKISKISAAAEAACNFQTLLVIQQVENTSSDAAPQMQELDAQDLSAFGSVALFLECTMQGDGGVELKVAFDETALTPFQAERFLWQMDHILRQLQMCPEQRLCDMDLMSPQDMEKIASWHGQELESVPICLHEMFSDRRLEQPKAPAIYSWDKEMTYEELDGISSKLAYYLRAFVTEREAVIPQLIQKSALGIVCEVAILKAGGTCLTLDSAHPEKRLSEIIAHAKAKTMLVSSQNLQILQTPYVRQLEVSWEWLETLVEPPPVNQWHGNAGSSAFLIFTSGSTGTPKGIVLEHEALATTVQVHAPEMNIVRGARVLHFASPSFDVSVYEVIMTLGMGGCLCIPSASQRMDDLVDFVQRSRADVAMISPTLLSSLGPRSVPSLKTITLVGEPIPKLLVGKWKHETVLMNGYGPGECTFCATTVIDEAARPIATVGIPTGCRFWIVDINNRTKLVPVGTVGEIAIQGPTLARGYLNDTARTEEAFAADGAWPAQIKDYRRTYFSGDLGRYNADGSVVYIGRADGQVKLRGQRIELGEVNFHLERTFANGAWAELIDFEDKVELVAFVVVLVDIAGDGSPVLPPSVKIGGLTAAVAGLESELPSYMVPTMFLPVRAVPRTVSGKYDRKLLQRALSGLGGQDILAYRNTQSTRRYPSTPGETAMRDIWAEVLHIEREVISVDDSFFRLGGSSVDAMRLVSVARDADVNLSVAIVFQHPCLWDMARTCDTANGFDMELVQCKPFGLMGTWDVDRVLGQLKLRRDNVSDLYPATYDQIVEFETNHTLFASFSFSSASDRQRMLQSWARVVADEDIFRTTLVSDGNMLWAVVMKEVEVALDGSMADFETLSRVVDQESPHGWLHGKPLFKVFFTNSHGTRPSMVLELSHAIFDGFSLPNIWVAWQNAYEGKPLAPRPRLQDVLYSRKAFTNSSVSTCYWHNLLAGSAQTCLPNPSPEFPAGTPLRRTIHGAHAPLGFVVDSLLKAAWATALAQLTHERDIVFWQITSGRRLGGSRAGISHTIGPLYHGSPVRVRDISSQRRNPTIVELCREMQEQDATGIMHEGFSDKDIWDVAGWPEDMPVGTVLNHVKMDVEGSMFVNGERVGPEVIYNEGEQGEFTVLVKSEKERLEVEITMARDQDVGVAGAALAVFCKNVEKFSRDPTRRVFET